MRRNEVFKSNFLKGSDLHGQGGPIRDQKPQVITIDSIEDGQTPDGKTQRVIVFAWPGEDEPKRLGLNAGRWDSLDELTGKTGDDESFVGATVELYPIPNVQSPQGGKVTGIGIRPAPKGGAPKKAPTKPAPAKGDDDMPGEAAPDSPDEAPAPEADRFADVKDKASAWAVVKADAQATGLHIDKAKAEWQKAVLAVGKPEAQFTADDWRNVAEQCTEIPF